MIKNLNADNDILFVQVDGYFHAFIIFNENGRLYIFQSWECLYNIFDCVNDGNF